MQIGPLLGLLALLLVQLGFIGAVVYLYFRIRTTSDMGIAERTNWAARIELAVTNADSAKRQAETIETEHYRKLRALYENATADLARCQADVKALSVKVLSEERQERRVRSREKPAPVDEEEENPEVTSDILEQLKKAGIAVPLQPQTPAPPQPARRFGAPISKGE